MAQSSPLTERIGEAAFSNLYRKTGPKLWAYIRRAASNSALADDIFQEAFLRFLRSCPAGLDERQQRAYLYRTATSLLVDHWRRAKRERMWGLKTLIDERAPDKKAMGEDMTRLFAQLKPREQALLWLAYVEGFDHREIATALELREKSVRVLLFRARKKMAEILTEVGLGPPGA
ncbi:MAG: RNA polymerase sigma factor [Acidobacteria bacterium]|nr:RNA polymerase sigma factor [Acidobacteriota bacterium]